MSFRINPPQGVLHIISQMVLIVHTRAPATRGLLYGNVYKWVKQKMTWQMVFWRAASQMACFLRGLFQR